MNIVETVNCQLIIANVNGLSSNQASSEIKNSEFSQTLSDAAQVLSKEIPVDEALNPVEIDIIVQKLLNGEMNISEVPEKYLLSDAIIKAVKSLSTTTILPKKNIDVVSDEIKEPNEDNSKQTVNLDIFVSDFISTYNVVNCTKEIETVKRIETAVTETNPEAKVSLLDFNGSETPFLESYELGEIPIIAKENDKSNMPDKSRAFSETNESQISDAPVNLIPLNNEIAETNQEQISSENNALNIENFSNIEAFQEMASEVIHIENLPRQIKPISENHTENIGKSEAQNNNVNSVVQAVFNPSQSNTETPHKYGENQQNAFLSNNSSKVEPADNSESLKSDFNITRFEVKSNVSNLLKENSNGDPEMVQSAVIKPQIIRSTEIKEIVIPKSSQNEQTDQQMPQIQLETLSDTPIKITVEGKEIEVKPEQIFKQVSESITDKLKATVNQDEYVVELEPAQLGKITIRLIKESGKLSVAINAENKLTQAILADKGDVIREAIKDNGVHLESWQVVSESKQEHTAQDFNGSSKNPYHKEESENPSDDENPNNSFAELLASM